VLSEHFSLGSHLLGGAWLSLVVLNPRLIQLLIHIIVVGPVTQTPRNHMGMGVLRGRKERSHEIRRIARKLKEKM